jgi:hypothetical protein
MYITCVPRKVLFLMNFSFCGTFMFYILERDCFLVGWFVLLAGVALLLSLQ